jgi:hypothetical protein
MCVLQRAILCVDASGCLHSPARDVRQNGATPLCYAAEKGHMDCLRALVELGAKLEAKDNVRAATCHPVWRCGRLLTLAGARRAAERNHTARNRCW